jgi:membrane protein implicated in regulation of membrane protease activity
VLDLGIDVDVWPWIWISVAVAFALIELTFLGGTFILLPFAASAFVAALFGFYDVSIEVQWAVFAFGGGLLFVVLYRWARRNLMDELPLGVGVDRLVGMTGVVTVEISPDDTDRRGRVALSGEVWGAISDTDRTLPAGLRVRVAAMRGTRVVVEPIDVRPIPNPSEDR